MNSKINLNNISEIEIVGIKFQDSPDFCDAYIVSGSLKLENNKIRDLTDEELDYINSNEREFVHAAVEKQLY